jgi:hypothetical protein
MYVGGCGYDLPSDIGCHKCYKCEKIAKMSEGSNIFRISERFGNGSYDLQWNGKNIGTSYESAFVPGDYLIAVFNIKEDRWVSYPVIEKPSILQVFRHILKQYKAINKCVG